MQALKKLEYLCLSCGWRKAIPASWGNSKPKVCPNQKCKTNFLLNPSKLASYDPMEKESSKHKQSEVPKAEKKHKRK